VRSLPWSEAAPSWTYHSILNDVMSIINAPLHCEWEQLLSRSDVSNTVSTQHTVIYSDYRYCKTTVKCCWIALMFCCVERFANTSWRRLRRKHTSQLRSKLQPRMLLGENEILSAKLPIVGHVSISCTQTCDGVMMITVICYGVHPEPGENLSCRTTQWPSLQAWNTTKHNVTLGSVWALDDSP